MDESFEDKDTYEIIKPLSAYHHYSKHNTSVIKDELLKEGKDASIGVVVSIVAAKWKTISEEEKKIYESMAFEDKERYNRECAIRDQQVLALQEEKRKMNSLTETSTKMRTTTIATTDAVTQNLNNKRKREISDKEKELKEERKQIKLQEEKAIKKQHDVLKEERVKQAEARLKYLLGQSDIFAHFGSGGKANASKISSKEEPKGRNRRASVEEVDEDEKALIEDEEKQPTILLKQPSLVSGGPMRYYQLEGLNWMIRLQENGINGILADEMGLGKTLQSISVIAYCKEFLGISGPHLIIVPKSTLSNWINEFARWTPSIKTLRFHGSKEDRDEIVSNFMQPSKPHDQRGWDVCVTTYEIINLEKNAISKLAWRYLIIDEAHRLKNEASQFSQTVRMLNVQHRLLLTGTPLQNNLHELWALLNFLLPDVFASSEQFDDWFNLDVDDLEAKQRIISQLHKLLRPFMLRRLKADVESSLPPKSETILFTGLSEMQKKLYRDILKREIDTINGTNGSRTAVLNIVMQLRKCCNHPYLFPGQEDRLLDPLGSHLYLNCGKMALLDKLLAKLFERGHRVLIFSQMTRMLDIIEDYFISKGYQYCRIDGNTSYEEREDRIHEFNKPDSSKFVFILSTRAGGLGINLQTADTVILYDSDWNPQADLQAQDRAHRIGQRKPVQVFRLVTDDTVEVKVVERAQQKLKLDAMVVQQGRLQDKEMKLSKNELLDTVRFGADKIFRSKESTITDDDVDMILEQGRQRTLELNEKLKLADKGDIYDFRLDGGMSTQVFEGKDYSDKANREAEVNMYNFAFIDPGKRERKPISNYAENINPRVNVEDPDKKPKLPRHLRLPRMEDWQFYDKARLLQLQEEEIRLFDLLVEKGEAPAQASSKSILLSPELHEEKTRLISEGFGDWTKVQYSNFIKASAKHGRNEFEKISKDIHKPVEEVKKYSEAFWSKGSKIFPPAEWEKNVKAIEKGEKRLEEIQRLTSATAKLISMFEDPWEELTFRNVGNQGRMYNAVEDRFLLCLTHLHGYGSWDLVRSSIRRCERFRFDFYLQSCSAEALGKRCEMLMRSAERELAEIERKKLVSDNSFTNITKFKSASDVNREKLIEIEKQIEAESRKLANARLQLQKSKGSYSDKFDKTLSSAVTTTSKTLTNNNQPTKATAKAQSSAPEKTKETASSRVLKPVPDEFLPELCKSIQAAKQDGIHKLVTQFLNNHPNISKRQVELKINEIAVKEKRAEDPYKVWHVKSEFERYLKGSSGEFSEDTSNSSDKKRENDLDSHITTPPAAIKPKKRKIENVSSSKSLDSQHVVITTEEPKKLKRAFGFFVKAKKGDALALLEDQSDQEALKEKLKEMWSQTSSEERKIYEIKEAEDKSRYEKEMASWKKITKQNQDSKKQKVET
mmetsp:Transcript_9123/g.8154  ORF Transcript_9123/g.8154 Transcript_9123/m.8154 type:complete len:1404 (-) Transcript_9123:63-4274(-)